MENANPWAILLAGALLGWVASWLMDLLEGRKDQQAHVRWYRSADTIRAIGALGMILLLIVLAVQPPSASVSTAGAGVEATASVSTAEAGLEATASAPTVEAGVEATASAPTVEAGVEATASVPTVETGVEATASVPTAVAGVEATASVPTAALASQPPSITLPAGGLSTVAGQSATLQGKGIPGAAIVVSAGAKSLGETVVDPSGEWTLNLPALDAGQYDLTVKQTTAEGQLTTLPEPAALTVGAPGEVAAQPPAVTLPAGGLSSAAGQPAALEGTGVPGAKIAVMEGAQALGEALVDAAGKWALALPALASGDHQLTVKQTTAEGQEATLPQPLTLTVGEAAAPAAQLPDIAVPVGGLKADAGATVTLDGVGAPGAAITVFNGEQNLGETVVGSDGKWTLTLPAPEQGAYALSLVQTDVEGNTSRAAGTFALAVNAPVLAAPSLPSVRAPGADVNVTAGATLPLVGAGVKGAMIAVMEGASTLATARVDAEGNWQAVAPPLSLGDHKLTVTQTTLDGTTTTAAQPMSVTVTTAPPILEGRAPYRVPSSRIVVGEAPAGTTVQISAGDELLGKARVESHGLWAFRLPFRLSPDTTELTLTLLDETGRPVAEGQAAITIGAPVTE